MFYLNNYFHKLVKIQGQLFCSYNFDRQVPFIISKKKVKKLLITLQSYPTFVF